MASSITLPSPKTPLLKSSFLSKNHRQFLLHKSSPIPQRASIHYIFTPTAKFDLSQLLGGRGLCNGEQGLDKELKRNLQEKSEQSAVKSIESPLISPEIDGLEKELKRNLEEKSEESAIKSIESVVNSPEIDGFEKELLGLTGGFPGGETGLRKFISDNPPPLKPKSISKSKVSDSEIAAMIPNPPDLPLLLPGMITIVKNPNNPYYMYCGIVQRITDGKAGVLFEGGNWDRLITFRLEELERREKGPPMKNPRSALLEPFLQKDSQ